MKSVSISVDVHLSDVMEAMTEKDASDIAAQFDLTVVKAGFLQQIREAAVQGDIAEVDRLIFRAEAPAGVSALPRHPDPEREIAIMPRRLS